MIQQNLFIFYSLHQPRSQFLFAIVALDYTQADSMAFCKIKPPALIIYLLSAKYCLADNGTYGSSKRFLSFEVKFLSLN